MSNLDCNIFCERAKELFGERGQIDLAESIGISQGVISAIKRNAPKAPSADTVYRIAKYFNVSADWLLGLSDVRSTDKATKELCDTLGLSDLTVQLLQNPDNEIARHCFDWLVLQHVETNSEWKDGEPACKNISMLAKLSELIYILDGGYNIDDMEFEKFEYLMTRTDKKTEETATFELTPATLRDFYRDYMLPSYRQTESAERITKIHQVLLSILCEHDQKWKKKQLKAVFGGNNGNDTQT